MEIIQPSKTSDHYKPVTGWPEQNQSWSAGRLCFDGQRPPVRWPAVSLCMIVKNEAAHLAACLQSVGDFAGEIIIVDTGSTDRTVEIAANCGATVRHFTWIDDFAAARNESIRAATGDWIFWMDADDRLESEDLIRLKQAAASGRADAYYCNVVSQFEDGHIGQDRIEHLRLFRNGQGVQFEKPLHEDAAPVAARLGLTIARTNIVVKHTGYTVSREQLLEKARRNRSIIEAALRQQPTDLQWRFHLGVTLHVLGEFAAAIEHLEAVVANPPPLLNRESYLYQAYEGLMLAYLNINQPQLARQTIDRALAEFAHRQHCWVRVGTIYLALDEPELAIESLSQAATLPPDVEGQSWAPGTIETHLIMAHLLLGQVAQARAAYLNMLTKSGKSLTPTVSDIVAQVLPLSRAKQYRQVVEFLQPVAHANPAALRLLAEAHAALQDWSAAAKTWAAVIALEGPQPGEWTTLAKYTLKAKEQARHARRFCWLALAEAAADADALNLLGIIALAHEGVETAVGYFVEAILADRQHQSAQNNLVQACRSSNLSQVEAIRKYSLRLMKQATNVAGYNQALAALGLLLEL
ncbi:MAG: glycosyltransferase, partial [Anaerolineae bacterium]|nr:glycosyltransferase [Anaerolineae bacterium]